MPWAKGAGAALFAIALGQAGGGAASQAPQLLAAQGVVQSTVTSISRRQDGEMVFRLANGQVWMQEAVGFMLVDPGERVIIAPTRFGGHILTTERSASTRVLPIEKPDEAPGLPP